MKKIFSLILSAVMALALLSVPVWADEETGLTAEATSNTNDQNYSVYYASTVKSYLVDTDGGLMRVEYTGSTDDGVVVEYYDSNYQITSQKYISFELGIFGGFYEGEDAYYLVFGQNNSDEDDSVEVVRVVKYSKDWERLGAASLYGANTATPFRAGSLRMAECNGYLYIRTSHLMYNGHQANMMIEVQESDMTVTDSYYSVSYYSAGYVSHSFNQFIVVDDDSNLVALDHGDAYPRAAILFKYAKQAGNSTFSGSTSYVKVFSFKGTAGTNSTGASLGGLEYSSTSYLAAGNSVTQDNDWSSHTARNVFVTVTSRSDFSSDGTEIKWITEYDTDGSISASTPQLVKLDTDQFLLLWTTTEYDDSSITASKQVMLHYVYLDGDGNMTSDIYTTDGQLSDCKPVVVDGSAVWYVTGDSSGTNSSAETTPVFYKITSDGTCTIYPELETPEITGISATDSGIEVTWNAVAGAEGYYVHYNSSTVTVTDANITSAVRSVSSGSTNYIWVEAYAGSSKSLVLNKQKFIYIKPELTNASAGIQVDWPEVTDASEYQIYKGTGDGSWSLVQTTADTSWTDQDVSSGSVFTYMIRTVLTDGTIYDSAESSVTYLSAPTLLGVTSTNSGIEVSWETVEGAASYRVYYKQSTASSYSRRTVTAGSDSTQSLTLSLTSGAEYDFYVAAYADGSLSGESETLTICYLETPTVTLSKNSTGIQLSWGGVTGAEGYKIYRKTGDGSYFLMETTSETSWTDTEISGGVIYTYQVYAYSGDSVSNGSAEVSNTITDISSCTITLSADSFTYDGTENKPGVTVRNNGLTLTEGTDYTVSFSNNVNAGTANVVITGEGDYAGTQEKTFTINKADQSVSAAASSSGITVGSTASISVSGAVGTVTYVSGNTDVATVDSNGEVTGVSAGTATISITAAGTDNYNAATASVTITVTGNSSGDTLMVRRGTTMYFNYILKGGNADFSISAGEATDQVLVGDWDGDGIDTICLRRGNYCYFIDDITTMHVYLTVTYGRSGDEVLVGDWDGDGCDSLAMRRNGNYYYFCNDITNPDGDTWSATYGRVNDEVHVGDWENSGYDSLAVRRNGNYYFFSLSKVTDPNDDVWVTTFGRAGDDVLVGDWDANGTDTLAMRRNGNTYYISNSIAKPDSGVDTFTFGRAGDEVYAGKWK